MLVPVLRVTGSLWCRRRVASCFAWGETDAKTVGTRHYRKFRIARTIHDRLVGSKRDPGRWKPLA